MVIDTSLWRLWLDIGQSALTLLVAGYVAWANHVRVTRNVLDALRSDLEARFDAIHQRVAGNEATLRANPSPALCADQTRRLAQVEESIRHMPAHADIKRLHERIDSVAELAAEVRGRLMGIERTLSMISEHLLDARSERQ